MAQATPEGAIIVDTVAGRCWELNRVGAAFWSQLDSTVSLRAITDSIQKRFGAPAESVEHDIVALVDALVSAGLVERTAKVP
jgi:hypothetical protein